MDKLSIVNKLRDLIELRDSYRADWPLNSLGYYTLNNYVKWYANEPQLRFVQIYSFNGNWRKNGLFLIVDRYQLFVNSLKPDDPELVKALRLLNWGRGYKITALPKLQYEIVALTLQTMRINGRYFKLNTYRMPRAHALANQFRCPSGFGLRSLCSDDAGLVNSLWPPRQAGSLHLIRRLIQFNISVGVYHLDTNELVAWCTRCQCGFLGSLYVKEMFRRRGLAAYVINAFARKVALAGDDVLVVVYEGNHASNALFQKLNFDLVDTAYHLRAFCVRNGLEWPEIEDYLF